MASSASTEKDHGSDTCFFTRSLHLQQTVRYYADVRFRVLFENLALLIEPVSSCRPARARVTQPPDVKYLTAMLQEWMSQPATESVIEFVNLIVLDDSLLGMSCDHITKSAGR
jgi:hypothetical protein